MTGPRRMRGRLDDDRRDPTDRVRPRPVDEPIEIEELHTRRVTVQGRSRPGMTSILAAGALVLLLGLGFGAFGGRRDAGASPGTSAALVPSGRPAVAGQTPAVTPFAPCTVAPETPPEVVLVVGETAVPASIEVLEQPRGVTPVPHPSGIRPPGDGLQRIPVAPSDPVAIQIAGNACANAWTVRAGGAQLSSLGNAGFDPAFASQNRFELDLASQRGSEVELNADLVFPALAIRATWLLFVEPYPAPEAYLASGSDRWRIEQGVGPFIGGIPSAHRVEAGELLTLSMTGWQFETADAWCGSLPGLEFTIDERAGCRGEGLVAETDEAGTDSVRFTGPIARGSWTILIVACGSQPGPPSLDRACDAWYATVEVDG